MRFASSRAAWSSASNRAQLGGQLGADRGGGALRPLDPAAGPDRLGWSYRQCSRRGFTLAGRLIHHGSADRSSRFDDPGAYRDVAGAGIWKIVDRPMPSACPRSLICGLTCKNGAPRGIRTPNRQIRSHASPVPACPPDPLPSPFTLVNGYVAGLNWAPVPACHVRLGRNVVAVSGHRRQTQRLAAHRLLAPVGG